MSQHETGEKEGSGERTWPEASVRERKDEANEATKNETTTNVNERVG